MENLTITEERVLRYLLGELSEKDQSAVEELFITDPECYAMLCEIEDDLIADYVRGRLEPHDLQQFKEYFLVISDQVQRVRVAQSLLPKIDEVAMMDEDQEPVIKPTLWQRVTASVLNLRLALRLMAAIAAFLIALGGGWLINGSRRLRDEADALRLESKRRESELREQLDEEKRRNLELEDEIAQLGKRKTSVTSSPVASATPGIVKLVLLADRLRGDKARAAQSLVIATEIEKVQLEYKMEDPGYPSYCVELYSAAGEKIWSSESISPRLNRSVAIFTITLSASELDNGAYTLSVSGVSKTGGIDPLGKPTFKVEKSEEMICYSPARKYSFNKFLSICLFHFPHYKLCANVFGLTRSVWILI
jgi:hypothetical protein